MQTGIDNAALQVILAVVAGLFALVVALKSFGYVVDDIRRRREKQPSESEPGSDP